MSVTWLETREVSVAELTKFPGNAKRGDVKAIRESIRRTGQYRAIVVRRRHVNDGGLVILAGNHTFEAIVAEGSPTVRCEIIECSDAEASRINLADNRLAELGTYDDESLIALLSGLDGDLSGTGWDSDDLDKFLISATDSESPAGAPPEEEIEAPTEPMSRPGDIWELGDHRIICGDCRDPEMVARLLDGRQIDLAFTSPPYAAQRTYDETSGFIRIKPDDYVDWFEPVQGIIRSNLAGSGSWFVNIKEHSDDGQRVLYVKDLTLAHVRRWGWRFVDELCWYDTANGFPGSHSVRYKNAWEPVFHFSVNKEITFHPYANGHLSDRSRVYDPANNIDMGPEGYIYAAHTEVSGVALPSNVIQIRAGSEKGVRHSAAFPVALPAWFIRAFSDPGDLVYDPFMGSGTTLIAAHREGRISYGVEISPAYCDVICQRFQKLTGITPELAPRKGA